MRIRQNPLWLWNPEETSPGIQNRGTNGPKIGHVTGFVEKTFQKIFNIDVITHHGHAVNSISNGL